MLLQRMRRILYSVLIFILLIFSLAQLTSVKAEDGGDVRRDVVILIDNSRSVALTNDEEANRIRAARFLARFLKATAPENTALGVSRFTLTSTQLVGLKPLSDWTEDDVSKIVAEPCPRDQKEICKGTNRALALQRALSAMGDCGMNDHICDVVLLTDIPLKETDSPPAQKLENMLYNASENGVNTYVVLFNNENRATDEMKWLAIKSLPFWQKWENNQLVQSLISVTSPVTVTYLYDSIVDSMAMENEFSEFGSIVSSGVTTRTLGPFPPLMKQLRVDTISDPAIVDLPFSVQFPGAPPPIKGDFDDYHWLLPDFERLTMTVQGQGLLFYRASPETMPADLFISTIPPQPKAGKPFSVRAVITGSHVLLNDSRTHVRAMFGTGNKPITLSNVAPGVWQYPAHPEDKWPILGAGDYAISANVDVDGEELPLRLHGDKLHVAESEQVARLSIYPTRVFTDQVIKLTLAYFIDDELVKVPDGGRIQLVSSQFTSSLPLLTLNPSGKMWTMTGTLAGLLNDVDLSSVDVLTAEVITDADNHSWTSESASIQVLKRPKLGIDPPRKVRTYDEFTVPIERNDNVTNATVVLRSFPKTEIEENSNNEFAIKMPNADFLVLQSVETYTDSVQGKQVAVSPFIVVERQKDFHWALSKTGWLFLSISAVFLAFLVIQGLRVIPALYRLNNPTKDELRGLFNNLNHKSPFYWLIAKKRLSKRVGTHILKRVEAKGEILRDRLFDVIIEMIAEGDTMAMEILLNGMNYAFSHSQNECTLVPIIYDEEYYKYLYQYYELIDILLPKRKEGSELYRAIADLTNIRKSISYNINDNSLKNAMDDYIKVMGQICKECPEDNNTLIVHHTWECMLKAIDDDNGDGFTNFSYAEADGLHPVVGIVGRIQNAMNSCRDSGSRRQNNWIGNIEMCFEFDVFNEIRNRLS